MWACPHCREALQLNASGASWSCINGHQFDCAREGYVNLLPAHRKRSRAPGDSAMMVQARRRVHEAHLYRRLAEAIEHLLAPLGPVNNVLDLGCGEGYYSTALQRAQPQARLHGVDISKPAVLKAARLHRKASFAVASAFDLPLLDNSVDIVSRVFAPSEDGELCRVLAPGGFYLEVAPAPGHLWEIRTQLYDDSRPHSPVRNRIAGMHLQHSVDVVYPVVLDQLLLKDVVAMTPFGHRGHREKRERLLDIAMLSVQMAFSLHLFQVDQGPVRERRARPGQHSPWRV